MNRPLISVVVPFVNHSSYIEPCWSNLQKQTYSNIELIFVDNGATDGGTTIANKIAAENHGKVRVVFESRKGIPFARNRGLNEAKGEFVCFLDIDDNFSFTKLETLYQLFIKFPEVAMAYGQTLRIYSDTGKKVIQETGVAKSGLNYPPDLAIDWTKSFYRLPQTGATLIRTQIAKTIGGFPENLLLGNDDVGFHMHIALEYPIAFEPFIAVEYYRHGKSEGARLNEQTSVHARYYDAHLKVTEPGGKKYFEATGNIKMWGYAQRGLFLNYLEVYMKNKNYFSQDINKPQLFNFYRMVLPLYHLLPFRMAHIIYKILRRPIGLLLPDKYPLQ